MCGFAIYGKKINLLLACCYSLFELVVVMEAGGSQDSDIYKEGKVFHRETKHL